MRAGRAYGLRRPYVPVRRLVGARVSGAESSGTARKHLETMEQKIVGELSAGEWEPPPRLPLVHEHHRGRHAKKCKLPCGNVPAKDTLKTTRYCRNESRRSEASSGARDPESSCVLTSFLRARGSDGARKALEIGSRYTDASRTSHAYRHVKHYINLVNKEEKPRMKAQHWLQSYTRRALTRQRVSPRPNVRQSFTW